MLHIESYVIKNKVFVINDIDNIDECLFVNITDLQSFDKSKLDYDYLNGAITILYMDKKILGFREWDLVDQLWYYFVDALIKLKTENNVEFTFPDQPFPVKMEKKGIDYLIINVNNKIVRINFLDFVKHMYVSAELFFNNLLILFPENKFDIQLSIDKVDELKTSYKLE